MADNAMLKFKTEYDLHCHIAEWLRVKYKGILFYSDTGSGVRLTIGNSKKMKRLRETRGYPDVVIFSANGGYHGLAIELKLAGTKIKLCRNDKLYASEHLKEQAIVLKRFQKAGYAAGFGVGEKQIKEIIDWYLALKGSEYL